MAEVQEKLTTKKLVFVSYEEYEEYVNTQNYLSTIYYNSESLKRTDSTIVLNIKNINIPRKSHELYLK